MAGPRIQLIHALPESPAAIRAAFARGWPGAHICDLMDYALAPDLQAAGSLTPGIVDRFARLTDYAVAAGAKAILFTCSAFGPAIDAARAGRDIPILKPTEAMVDEALAAGSRLAVLATFAPTLDTLIPEIEARARELGRVVTIETGHVPGALAALQAGRAEEHDALIAAAAARLAPCDALMLAQFSMARAAATIAPRPDRVVLTSPDAAVARLRSVLGG